MDNYCNFMQNGECPEWLNFELMKFELEEASELCHGNRIEIQRLRQWTDALTAILDEHGIPYPSEWDL